MRVLVVVLATFIVGFVVGGYAPRSELDRVRRELVSVREQQERAGRDSSAWAAAGLGQLLQARAAQADATAPPPAGVPHAPPGAPPQAPPDLQPPADTDDEPYRAPDGGDRPAPIDHKARFQQMRDAAQLRSEQFRSKYIEAAQLDDAAVARLDEVIREMNADFAREAERAVRHLDGAQSPPRVRDFVDASIPLLQAFQHADDRMSSFTSPGARAVASHVGFDLSTQIDPGAFESMLDLLRRTQKTHPKSGDNP